MDAQKMISLHIECAQRCAGVSGCDELARGHLQIAFDTLHKNYGTIKNWERQVGTIMALWRIVSEPKDRISGITQQEDEGISLTEYQKAQLLHVVATGGFVYRTRKGFKVSRTAWVKMIDVLLGYGLIGENAKATDKGKEYCDRNHLDIDLSVLD